MRVQVGKAMSSNESAAYEIMRDLDVDYVLAIFGGVIGYSGDDINKFLWMVRIAEGEHPKEIRVRPSSRMIDCSAKSADCRRATTLPSRASTASVLALRTSCSTVSCTNYATIDSARPKYIVCAVQVTDGKLQVGYQQPAGFDRTRGYVIGKKDVELEHLEEAYTTENWLVRIYKVKEPANRPKIKYTERQIRSKRTKTSYPKKVSIRHG